MAVGHTLEDNLSSKELLERGKIYAKNRETNDSAIYILSELINRYAPGMSKEEKIYTIKAHQTLAHTYLSSYFNYTKAEEHLLNALELCDDIDYDKSQIYLSMGLMLHTMIDSNDLPDLIPQTKQYYLQAIEEAQRHNNTNTAVVALLNLVEIARLTQCLPEIKSQISIV
ncbi:MAG: hypothetical protein K2H75_01715, partial [Muribaculaceae bacterium]|nr:hypothetical protein [Muribaculaceae bacterium]